MNPLTEATDPASTDQSPDPSVLSDKEYCDSCDKPLGGTGPTCYTCGGEPTRRGGGRITPEPWQGLLGVPHHLIARHSSGD